MKVKWSRETVGELNQLSSLHIVDPNGSILLIFAAAPQPPRLPTSPLQWLRIAVPFIYTHPGGFFVGLLQLETNAAAKGLRVRQFNWPFRPIRQGAICFFSSIAFNPPLADSGHQILFHRLSECSMQGLLHQLG